MYVCIYVYIYIYIYIYIVYLPRHALRGEGHLHQELLEGVLYFTVFNYLLNKYVIYMFSFAQTNILL